MIKSIGPVGQEWGLKLVVQVGSVAAARQAARDGADIIVAQGTDAGGHQWASGAGIISLVPEISDMLKDEFADREIGLWAAGGIADGRGVAAALALGAEGAVLGTRVSSRRLDGMRPDYSTDARIQYMVATESLAQDFKRQAIIATTDGGANTVKLVPAS